MWITVGARNSRLSKMQVIELFGAVTKVDPAIRFNPLYMDTVGDRDLKTSLNAMDKTDFFTKDIEKQQIRGKCRISVHSAKDLPEKLTDGLEVVAITKGVSGRDVLLYRGDPKRIGTSSDRREEAVKMLFPNAECASIRGPVDDRIAQWNRGDYDGIVVAEAALIRLGLMHLQRTCLPGEASPLQGKLAVVGWRGDKEMQTLFSEVDTR
jgi:hydroxymethylbilane synthase